MEKALIDTYTDEEFISLVKTSYSMSEICRKLGYSAQ